MSCQNVSEKLEAPVITSEKTKKITQNITMSKFLKKLANEIYLLVTPILSLNLPCLLRGLYSCNNLGRYVQPIMGQMVLTLVYSEAVIPEKGKKQICMKIANLVCSIAGWILYAYTYFPECIPKKNGPLFRPS